MTVKQEMTNLKHDIKIHCWNRKPRIMKNKPKQTIYGLFMTNKNVTKCDVCIKAEKQNVLTEGTNNFSTNILTTHPN
jgi:hypothetical protein